MLMKVFERYFSRNPVSRQLSFEADTAVIVIIPVFNDPDIFATLDSLCCCSVMNIKAGVLIVVNHSEVCPQEIKTRNIGLSDTLKRYVRDRQTDRLRFEVVEAFDLPAKYAGVGLARKIAMDLSAAFFYLETGESMLLFFLWMLTPGSNRIIWRRWSVIFRKNLWPAFLLLMLTVSKKPI